MYKLASALILGCFINACVHANANKPVTTATNTSSEKQLSSVLSSQEFIITGEAMFSILFWDLYKSQLKTTSGTYPISLEEEQLIFHINYFADISNEALIKRTVEQWKHQGISKGAYHHYIEQLKQIWPNISKGDSLAILMEKEKSTFYFNDQYIGEINDGVFGQLFVDIWLDESTSQPSLRAQLLGGGFNE
ncbi:MAG: hypothetical protein GY787_19150 [Alteromonadales bacterium]|nr:hypothetical protein [Alteromonadales bacterium]